MWYANEETINRLNDAIIDAMYTLDCEIDYAIDSVLDANCAQFVWSVGEIELWELPSGERISVHRDGLRRAVGNESVEE